jgi:16S rRNA (guanine527-N7)-methyltransferase
MSLDTVLSQGLAELGLECPPAVQARLLAYVQLLAKWNRVYNLTAVREPREMVIRHLLDSLAVLPYLHGQRVLDVGAGAGLPGMPLAMLCPERHFVLLDSNGKKTRFVQQAVTELGLINVQVVQARVAGYRPEAPFDTVISRAFATVADMLRQAGRHCVLGGVLLAMKGGEPDAELAALPGGYKVQAVHRLTVPGLREERHLVCLTPAEDDKRD